MGEVLGSVAKGGRAEAQPAPNCAQTEFLTITCEVNSPESLHSSPNFLKYLSSHWKTDCAARSLEIRDGEQVPLAKHGVELLPMIATIPDHLQQEVLVARCVVEPGVKRAALPSRSISRELCSRCERKVRCWVSSTSDAGKGGPGSNGEEEMPLAKTVVVAPAQEQTAAASDHVQLLIVQSSVQLVPNTPHSHLGHEGRAGQFGVEQVVIGPLGNFLSSARGSCCTVWRPAVPERFAFSSL